MTTEQPAAKAGAAFLVIIASGKFQGVITPTTPTASLVYCNVVSFAKSLIMLPRILLDCSANHWMKLAAYTVSPIASAKGLPCSSTIILANSSLFAITKLYQSKRIVALCFAGVSRQTRKDFAAAWIASLVSVFPIEGTFATNELSAGFVTSYVFPFSADTHFPFIKPFSLKRDEFLSSIILKKMIF